MSSIIADTASLSCYDTYIEITVIAHNIRSTHNVGSLFRTCDGFGVSKLILSGYTPYPRVDNDQRLPHIIERVEKQLHKTALGAEKTVRYDYQESPPIESLKAQGYRVIALEQHPDATTLPNSSTKHHKIAILLGEERYGITPELLAKCDEYIEIPMFGKKESFNVSIAAAIALYHYRVK